MTETSLNILVVDDEINIRKTLSMRLETTGHKVVAVGNFADAVTEVSRKSIGLASWTFGSEPRTGSI